jgi:hypothetical protein
MAYTVRQFVTSALEELGLADYVFDLAPEQLASAAKRMQSMLAEWNAKGLRVSATLNSDPDSIDIDTDSGIPDKANDAIITMLAVRIAPMFGKTPSSDTKAAAKAGYNTLLSLAAMPPEMQLPGSLPAGAGAKYWRTTTPFVSPPTDQLGTGDSVLEF